MFIIEAFLITLLAFLLAIIACFAMTKYENDRRNQMMKISNKGIELIKSLKVAN